MARKVLIVEDETNIAELLHLYLEKEGFETAVAPDGGKGVELFRSFQPDLVLLDIMLPVMDGWSVLKKIRENDRTPVIMLTAKGETDDKVNGLEMGADDYLPKPFSVLELIARVKALFRRQEAMGQNIRLESGSIACHGLDIEPLSREVRLRGEPVELTPREFDLLYWFARHPGEVFSRLSLLDRVWGYQHEGYEHTVNTHINRLRIKIERDPAEPEIILTVWGKGYKFATEKTESTP